MEIDRRKKYMIVLDCETAPLDSELCKVDPYNMVVYDLGFAVVDKKGNVYKTCSYINSDIFINEFKLMGSAYYANKIPRYIVDLANGTRQLKNWWEIRDSLMNTIKEYNVTEIYAHNMRFDYGSINNTQRYITKSKYRYYFSKNLVICDTLKMARQVLGKMPSYKRFCLENGYMTKNNQCRYTAEVIYRFITKDNDFSESHTGLEDVLIEKDILAYILKQHKKCERRLWVD